MPEITRRSSTRGTPRGLFGNNGPSRSNCASVSQNSEAMSVPLFQQKGITIRPSRASHLWVWSLVWLPMPNSSTTGSFNKASSSFGPADRSDDLIEVIELALRFDGAPVHLSNVAAPLRQPPYCQLNQALLRSTSDFRVAG